MYRIICLRELTVCFPAARGPGGAQAGPAVLRRLLLQGHGRMLRLQRTADGERQVSVAPVSPHRQQVPVVRGAARRVDGARVVVGAGEEAPRAVVPGRGQRQAVTPRCLTVTSRRGVASHREGGTSRGVTRSVL